MFGGLLPFFFVNTQLIFPFLIYLFFLPPHLAQPSLPLSLAQLSLLQIGCAQPGDFAPDANSAHLLREVIMNRAALNLSSNRFTQHLKTDATVGLFVFNGLSWPDP